MGPDESVRSAQKKKTGGVNPPVSGFPVSVSNLVGLVHGANQGVGFKVRVTLRGATATTVKDPGRRPVHLQSV